MAILLKGAPAAAKLTEQALQRAQSLRSQGVVPTLAIVRMGERDDDLAYQRGAQKRCEKTAAAWSLLRTSSAPPVRTMRFIGAGQRPCAAR